jgi:hypothetical protein
MFKMLNLKKISIGLFLSTLSSTAVFADSYVVAGGLTSMYTAIINRYVGISPTPTGIQSGVLEIDINHETGLVTVAPGAEIVLSDFNGTISFIGTTSFTAVATGITVHLGGSGVLDGDRNVTVSSEIGSPGVDVDLDIQNCTGILCGLLPSFVLDVAHYTVTASFNEDFSVFMGTLVGMAEDGSAVEMVINGMRI